jgi:hypothetical protein
MNNLVRLNPNYTKVFESGEWLQKRPHHQINTVV